MLKMSEIDLSGKRVLIRQDLNVPFEGGYISNVRRLEAALPTLKAALGQGASVVVMSHLGRPQAGHFDDDLSLAPIASWLADALEQQVDVQRDWPTAPIWPEPGQLKLCENVRFFQGEVENDPGLAAQLAAGAEVFVMDAFGTAHRCHASTCGVGDHVPLACAGPLLVAELSALDRLLKAPPKPLVAVIGGSKVSSKIKLLSALIHQADSLVVGGGIANTFLAASGVEVGISKHEPELIPFCEQLLEDARALGVDIVIPEDVVLGAEMSNKLKVKIVASDKVVCDGMILDVGPRTLKRIASTIAGAGTVLWNGPLGFFELQEFENGTRCLAEAVASSDCITIAGGGDTLCAVDQFGVAEAIDHLSTGGGAFLAYLEGQPLPAIAYLEQGEGQRA